MVKADAANIYTNELPGNDLFVNRLCYALTFAKKAVLHLMVDGHPAPENVPWYVRPEKIIAETAFLIAFSKRNETNSEVATAVKELAEVLEPLARSEKMLLNICVKPALALDYGHAHICLTYAGYPNERFDRVLDAALHSHAANGVERTPYRMMELEWLRSIWKHEGNGVFDYWIPQSCLNHPVDLFSESSDGTYAITHAIMYASFQGENISKIDCNALFDIIETLVIRFMDEQNYDVAGELLMAWPLLKRQWSPAALFALDSLFKIEARVGFLPAPGLERSIIDAADQTERRTYIYSINYHTVLVMGLLCSTLLDRAPEKERLHNGVGALTLSSKYINEIKSGKQVHWVEFFDKLGVDQQQELQPWIFQICILRWIKENKYGKVKDALGEIKEDFQRLPICRQASELLQRLSLIKDL